MQRDDLAWLAGVLDGEGYFGPGSTRRLVPRIHLSQNDREMLDRVAALLPFDARVVGPYRRNGRHWHYELHINGFERVQATAALVWPWLGLVKRRQAAFALWQSRRWHAARLRRPQRLPSLVCRNGHLRRGPGRCRECHLAAMRRYYFRHLGTI